MTSGLAANSVLDATALLLDSLPLDPTNVIEGTPVSTASDIVETPDLTAGVWELTPGTVTDVEVDEVFVVISGAATLEFEDGRVLELRPGSIGRLAAGTRTRWVVTETLRKVYFSAGAPTAGPCTAAAGTESL